MTTDTTEPTTTGSVRYDAANAITLREKAWNWHEDAQALIIDSPGMYEAAGADLRAVKQLADQVEAERTKITKPLNDALRAVNDLFRPAKQYLEQAEATVKRAMLGWSAEQERKAEAARREQEARERAERQRLADEEAVRRLEAAELARHAQEAAAAGNRAEADRLAQDAATAAGEADALSMEQAVVTMAPALFVAPPVAVGVSKRVTWSAEVTDLKELLMAVINGQAPIEAICADQKFLDQQAKAFKRTALYPGVQGKPTTGIAARK